jgi:hypothetical protein
MLEQGIPAGAESTVEVDRKSAGDRKRKRSVAAKLLQVAALAGALVPLSAMMANATTITADCFYNLSGAACGPQGPNGGGMFRFGSDPYVVELKFDEVLSEGVVTIAATTTTSDDLTSRFSSEFAGWAPVPICPECDESFIDFQVTTDDTFSFSSEGDRGPSATKGYDLFIYWLDDTNALFPNPQMLHATGSSNIFDQNIRTAYFSELDPDETCFFFGVCGGPGLLSDPGAGGRDNMFSEFTLADPTAVPEPASLLLLGTGVSALMYRRRRRNAESQKAQV